MTKRTILEYWSERAHTTLVGRTIVDARYLSAEEMAELGWTKSVLVMQLDDGTVLFPSMDDEGNNGGAMFGQKGGEDTGGFPVVPDYSMNRERPEITPMSLAPDVSSKPRSYKPRGENRVDATKRKLLKRLQSDPSPLHYGNEKTLRELKEEGFIGKMEKKRVPGKRVPYIFVELTKKGKAA